MSMAPRDSITLLHLSDVQFGRNYRFGNLALSDPDAEFDTLFRRLSDDLGTLEKEDVRPELLVVSGDLAESGMKSEFKDALELLIKLSERLEIPHQRVVIVPGNHDINRKLCEGYFTTCEGQEEVPAKPYWPKWDHYISLFQELYGADKNIAFTIEEPWSFWELEDLNLVVAGLNSTIAESHLPDTHYGWVGERQLRWFGEHLAPFGERGWLRMGVVHHNIERGAAADDENLRDADDLKSILGPSLNLLLHGHTHNGKIAWAAPTLPVLSTGSAALTAEARPTEVPNQYQAIRLWADGIERWTRRYDPEQKRWIGDTRCSEAGDRWHIRHPVPFGSVFGTFSGVALARPQRTPGAERHELEHVDRERREPRNEFLSRVREVCKLRYGGVDGDANVDTRRVEGSRLDYLRVHVAQGPIARIFPLGVCEHGVSEEQLEQFRLGVFAQYRAHDASLPFQIVYGGDRAPDELIRRAAAEGVQLLSFVEFQGIIDFRGYVDRQTRKLESDIVYPPKLYVPQRFVYELGRQEHSSRDSLRDVMEWLKEPLGRFVLVLGDFGAGKTFLLHELARRMPTEIPHLVPVLVELRTLEKAPTLEQLIAQQLAAAGERFIDLAAFPYMLREGRIALLFDGFDELAQRVTYLRATEHFETLLQAAGGRAKVVVTSRTQHFESDQQVKTALLERAETQPGLYLARLQPFDEPQILEFLTNLLGDSDAAASRFKLIDDIRDLLGLSHNPRMLNFIANLPEEQLREAEEKTGKITSADLYRLLIDRWLAFEYERTQPKGAPPSLSMEERWNAVTALASYLWQRGERTIRLTELTDEVAHAVDKLTEKQLDRYMAAHLVGSGTLLVRDEEGAFAFVHQSVMEWLVANLAVQQLAATAAPAVLAQREMSPLMADFFCDLAGPERASEWAKTVVAQPEHSLAKANALLVLGRLEQEIAGAASLAGQNLSGRDFSRQSLAGANLMRADLTEARLEDADLTSADLTEAVLERADLTRAKLIAAKLERTRAAGARFLGADLSDAILAGADLRRAKLVGARLSTSSLAGCDTFGAAPPEGGQPDPMISATSSCNSVAFASDGVVAAGGYANGSVRLWDANSGEELRTLSGHRGSVLSVAFTAEGGCLASGGGDGSIRLWDVNSGAELRALTGHEGSVLSIAFTAADGGRLASAGDDATVRLWDVNSGEELLVLAGHEDWVRSVAFAPDGGRLASGSDDGSVRVWDVNGGEELLVLGGHERWVRSVAFAPDGGRLASGGDDGSIRLWDVNSGAELRALSGHQGAILSVAFTPDGGRLASAGEDQTVRLWDVSSGEELRTLRGRHGPVFDIAFTADGGRLASAGDDGSVRFWDVNSGKELRTLGRHLGSVFSIALTVDGGRLASASRDRTVRLWDVNSGEELLVLAGHEDWVRSVAFAPDGRRLASAGDDESVRLWDVISGEELLVLRGHEEWIYSVTFAPDGGRLASAGGDARVRLWDLNSGEEMLVLEGHEDWVRSVAFAPDGGRLASGSDDGTVRLWDTSSGEELLTLRGHQGWVYSVAFSADGGRLASAGGDGSVRHWDAMNGEELNRLRGHDGSVLSVAFTADGQRLASTGEDGTVRLWDAGRGVALATLVGTAEGWAAFTPDGRYKMAGNLGGALWYAIGLCRFELGELDAFLPPGTLRHLAPEEPLWSSD